MDNETRRQLRLFVMKLEELADAQRDMRDKTGESYHSGSADAYADSARRVAGLISSGRLSDV